MFSAPTSDFREKKGLGPAHSPHPQSIKKTEKNKTLPFRRNYGRPYRVSNAESNFSMCHSLENWKLSAKQLATSKNMKKHMQFRQIQTSRKRENGGAPPWEVPPLADPLHGRH